MPYVRKILETLIGWIVPVIGAAALVLWRQIPEDAMHYWPVAVLGVLAISAWWQSVQVRKDVAHLRELHAKDDKMGKAFRAILDDDMGKLYVKCLEKGYTTEDERRRYDRLDSAYTSLDGNGEAARRKPLFHAIAHEEEWNIKKRKGKKNED